MIETITIYILLFAVTFLLAYIAKKTEHFEYITYAIIIYSILFGMRYGVGVDQLSYLNSYLLPPESLDRKMEPGFFAIFRGCQMMDFHFAIFFGIIAFLQLFLVFRAVKDYREVYTYLMATFMLGCVWLTFNNGLRQILALCLFIFAISLIHKKKPIWHYIMLVLAFLMHKSAILLFPLYPIFRYKREWFTNIKWQLILFVAAMTLMQFNVVEVISEFIDDAAITMGYGGYTEEAGAKMMNNNEITLGLGFVINTLINLFIIIFSNKTKEEFKDTWMPIAYNLYFVGALINLVFIRSILIGRVNYYFYGLDFIMGAFTLAYLVKSKKPLFYILLGLYAVRFVAVMSKMDQNTALFRFFWNYI